MVSDWDLGSEVRGSNKIGVKPTAYGNRRGSRTARLCVLWLAGSLLLAQTLFSDVLVTREGARVETRGAWEVKGRQVVFELPNGALSSLRLSEIDLDASRAATRAGTESRHEAIQSSRSQERESVLVITNESLGLNSEGQPADSEEEEAENTAGGLGTPGVIATQGDVVVVDWSYDSFGEDPVYMVSGVIENRGPFVAEQVSVHMDIVAVDEETGAQQPNRHILRRARVRLSSLPPGASTEFSYGVTEQDLSVHGGDGFGNPLVSFDVQFRQGELPPADGDDEDVNVSLALVDRADSSASDSASGSDPETDSEALDGGDGGDSLNADDGDSPDDSDTSDTSDGTDSYEDNSYEDDSYEDDDQEEDALDQDELGEFDEGEDSSDGSPF